MSVPWEPWSASVFARAKAEAKPVVLHIGATWCHWCHVMDNESYTWPGVAEILAARFVCVRVDADQRPDLNERYNQGGWPSLAILDAEGEVLVGRTYIPGFELLSLLRGASDPNSRWSVAPEPAPVVGQSTHTASDLWAAVQAAYDPYYGGFGELNKFPHPSVLDWLCDRAQRGDAWATESLRFTQQKMLAAEVYDTPRGGFFRYATRDDWGAPHVEKLLEDNARLCAVWARSGSVPESLVRYLLATLYQPETGRFGASQAADEGYYPRGEGAPPAVDATDYAGWNALAARAFVLTGAQLARPGLCGVGLRAMRAAQDDAGCVQRSIGGEVGLLDDQVQVALGALAVGAVFGNAAMLELAERCLSWAWAHLRSPDGGLWDRRPGAVARLRHVRRSVFGNAAFAEAALALHAHRSGGPWRQRAEEAVRVALAESGDWGFLAAAAGQMAERLAAPVRVIKVASPGWPIPEVLLRGIGRAHPDEHWIAVREGVPAGTMMVCSESACSRPLRGWEDVLRTLQSSTPDEARS